MPKYRSALWLAAFARLRAPAGLLARDKKGLIPTIAEVGNPQKGSTSFDLPAHINILNPSRHG